MSENQKKTKQELSQDEPAIDDTLSMDDSDNEKGTAALGNPTREELEAKLTKAEQEATDYWNKLLRAQADLENARRRAERDVANAHKFGLEKFVGELLPVVDSLERALEHNTDEALWKVMHEGIELTLDLLLKAIEKFGVEQLNPVGEIFNPEHHAAISMQEDPKAKPNTVLQVFQKGYLLNGRLIRPATVIIAKG